MVNEINKLKKVEKYGGDYRWELEKCWPPNQHPPTHTLVNTSLLGLHWRLLSHTLILLLAKLMCLLRFDSWMINLKPRTTLDLCHSFERNRKRT